MCENNGDVIDIMDTANLDQESNRNCSLNIIANSSHNPNLLCDTVDTTQIRTRFGFIPKGPLKLYDGNPGFCNRIPDIINAHLLIRESGLPNYLGCRYLLGLTLSVIFGLNILQNTGTAS